MTSVNITLKALATYRARLIQQHLQINAYVHRKNYLYIFGEKINLASPYNNSFSYAYQYEDIYIFTGEGVRVRLFPFI